MFHDTFELADGTHEIFASLGVRDQAVRKGHRLEQIVRLAKADPLHSLYNINGHSCLLLCFAINFDDGLWSRIFGA